MDSHKETIDAIPYDKKIAYFPDGYRKKNTDIVSPRALKHIQELEEIVTTTDKRAILCFVIQRSDVDRFQPSNIDPTYRKAVQQAYLSGVEIKTLQVTWNPNGICYFVRNDLPIHIFSNDDDIM
jgi:DNA-binding sugar fermentation-stimulating protein